MSTTIDYGALVAENAQLKADLTKAHKRAEAAEQEAQRLASELTRRYLRAARNGRAS